MSERWRQPDARLYLGIGLDNLLFGSQLLRGYLGGYLGGYRRGTNFAATLTIFNLLRAS